MKSGAPKNASEVMELLERQRNQVRNQHLDMYNEQMFERKANGLEVISYAQWDAQHKAWSELFDKLMAERSAKNG